MKQLIVNADDFGYTRGVNRAIVEACHQNGRGIITATSLMANAPAFDHAVELAHKTAGLDVGCHLNLVEGRPLSPASAIPSLVNADGQLLGARRLGKRLLTRTASGAEIECECAAQVDRMIAAGIPPTHLDTHQHAHLHPTVATAVARTAQRYGIAWVRRPFESFSPPTRLGNVKRRILAAGLRSSARSFDRIMAAHGLRCPDHFSGFVLTGALTVVGLRATLALLPDGATELMCHPGYTDAALARLPTSLQAQRQRELEALCDPGVRDVLRARGIQLISFRELSAPASRAERTSALKMAASGGQASSQAR